jgi:hypothetical protein
LYYKCPPLSLQYMPMESAHIEGFYMYYKCAPVPLQYMPVESAPIEGFYIYYKPYSSPGEYKQHPLLGSTLRSHLITKLTPNTEYSIKMQCFNSAGQSEFSNAVVKPTKPRVKGDRDHSPPFPPQPEFTPKLSPDTDSHSPAPTKSPSAAPHQSSSEMLYMVLGIVLGVMMLLPIVFMFMCWWKQRQQRRMMGKEIWKGLVVVRLQPV